MDRTFLHRDVREASPFRTKKDFFESETNLTSARKMRERSLSSRSVLVLSSDAIANFQFKF